MQPDVSKASPLIASVMLHREDIGPGRVADVARIANCLFKIALGD
jgi:hypothetical protein